MSRIFGEISRIVTKYEGFIEKFIGDAVVALFGVPKAHEDDPIRAIRAAREIHELVEGLGPQLGQKIGQPLRMHTGIDTGLVVTGEVDPEKGTHGVSGESLNIASRLSGLAKPGEIVIGSVTYSQAEGHFAFEGLGPTKVKGRAGPIQAYRVLSPMGEPSKVHRLHGMRAELIGRKVEMALLGEALDRLREKEGNIICICGDAGTGKSRLVEEFKATLDLEETQWLEGHAYSYAQNIPYFPLIDLLNGVFQVEEGDPPKKVKAKIESGVEHLVGKKEDVLPYVGSLYALSYTAAENMSPESWKSRLKDAVQMILSALARRTPTILYLEDLHWADPSFVELLRNALLEIREPAIVLCVYRPTFNLFTSHQLRGIGKIYQEIRLQDLSPSESQDMLGSLLKVDSIPADLRRFVQDKAEGNPFYLEELVNSLIDSGTLIREDGNWTLIRLVSESDISPTIHGVISGRLDRLEKEEKRIIQEASVIGRAFLYKILERVTELKADIDPCLRVLERLDLIRTRPLQPDLEYVFKHALTQEVVYNGLLKKERKEIHERIGQVMEQLFRQRLSEHYETLALHFTKGHSVQKAVDYLIKSGERSLKRYALEDSHWYFKKAFDFLSNRPNKTKQDNRLLIDLLNKWSFTFHYRGYFYELNDLLGSHVNLAKSIDDRAKLGMFYAWMGYALHYVGRLRVGYQYLRESLHIGEQIGDKWLIGWSCAFLTWTCVDLGLVDEAIRFGEKGRKIIKRFLSSDQELFFVLTAGIGYAYFCKGQRAETLTIGRSLEDFGHRYSNSRSLSMGYFYIAASHLISGSFLSAMETAKKGVHAAKEPMFAQNLRIMFGLSCCFGGEFEQAEKPLREVVTYSKKFGYRTVEVPAYGLLGLVLIAKGQMKSGLKIIEEARQSSLENGYRFCHGVLEYILGKMYSQIFEESTPLSIPVVAKNLGFLLRSVPFTSTKAENHFNKAIEVAKEIGANGILGQVYLDLGLFYKTRKRTEKARECITEALQIFEQCEAELYLKQAKEALASLN